MPHELSSSAITAKRLWVVHHHCTLNILSSRIIYSNITATYTPINKSDSNKRHKKTLVSPESLSITHLLSPAPPRGAAEESSLLDESSELLLEDEASESAAQNFDIVWLLWIR